jgi:hypothetical protein
MNNSTQLHHRCQLQSRSVAAKSRTRRHFAIYEGIKSSDPSRRHVIRTPPLVSLSGWNKVCRSSSLQCLDSMDIEDDERPHTYRDTRSSQYHVHFTSFFVVLIALFTYCEARRVELVHRLQKLPRLSFTTWLYVTSNIRRTILAALESPCCLSGPTKPISQKLRRLLQLSCYVGAHNSSGVHPVTRAGAGGTESLPGIL